ncbi:MAG TPA: hypothetical protein VE177_00115 [Candidatus Binatus sp.]|nr:hypothetical protein [Candidatus Binatus sp.]
MSASTTVEERKLLNFGLKMRSLGVHLTDSELEALKALLTTEHASPVKEDCASSEKKWGVQSPRRQQIE